MINYLKAWGITAVIIIGVMTLSKGSIWGAFILAGAVGFIIDKFFELERNYLRIFGKSKRSNLEENPLSLSEGNGCLSYRVRINIMPKWEEIVPYVPKESKPRHFWSKIFNDPELEVDKENSLLGKNFSYVIYEDRLSGMSQKWSNNFKTFVDDLEISGCIIYTGNLEKLTQKYCIPPETAQKSIIISPSHIGYLEYSHPSAPEPETNVISQIPFEDIVYHLTKLKEVWGEAMGGILKFPDKLQEEFNECKVKYETSDNCDYGTGMQFSGTPIDKEYKQPQRVGFELSTDLMNNHIFSTKYYSIAINIEFFDKPNF